MDPKNDNNEGEENVVVFKYRSDLHLILFYYRLSCDELLFLYSYNYGRYS